MVKDTFNGTDGMIFFSALRHPPFETTTCELWGDETDYMNTFRIPPSKAAG
jgi:hypothetical protein